MLTVTTVCTSIHLKCLGIAFLFFCFYADVAQFPSVMADVVYLMFLNIMVAQQVAEELCQDESCKLDFLMYKIHQEISNPNIGMLLSSIYEYIENEGGQAKWIKRFIGNGKNIQMKIRYRNLTIIYRNFQHRQWG